MTADLVAANPDLVGQYPWLEASLAAFKKTLVNERQHHAWLITGAAGIGKYALARHITATLLCQSEDRQQASCGQCTSCRAMGNELHPDIHEVQPDDGKVQIKIEQLRQLAQKLSLSSHGGQGRVAIICPAENMNRAAANSLLKTLEEPANNVTLLLISHDAGRLLPTIRSRCLKFNVVKPDALVVQNWLQATEHTTTMPEQWLRLAHQQPLHAAELIARFAGELPTQEWARQLIMLAQRKTDIVSIADAIVKVDEALWLNWLALLLETAVISQYNVDVNLQLSVAERKLVAFINRYPASVAHEYLQRILLARRMMEGSVNKPSTIEALLLPWLQGFVLQDAG